MVEEKGMTVGDRIRNWITSVFGEIAEAFASFFHAPFEIALEWIMDKVADESYVKIGGYLDDKVEKGQISAEARKEFDDIMGDVEHPIGAIIGMVTYMAIMPMLQAGLEPFSEALRHEAWGKFQFRRLTSSEVLAASFHNPIYDHLVAEDLGDYGYTKERIEAVTEAYRPVLKEGDIRDLFLRGVLGDRTTDGLLDKIGYAEDDKADIEKLFWTVPPLADMVRFADFSAFDQEVIDRWIDYFNCPEWLKKPFEKVGINDEEPDRWASRYWFSHFRQPGRFELGELHRRNLISEKDIKLAYKTMGYSSYWQDKLFDLVKAVPTRVDVRRFWDLRVIDEKRLSELYKAQGYYDKDNLDYVNWTKLYSYLPDALKRWQNGWISLDDIRTELKALKIPDARVEEIIQTKIKAEGGPRVQHERDVTKAEIIKGVKKEVITREEGNILLQAMNYDAAEAAYILAINIPEDGLESTARKRELTKSDILKGLKVGVINSTVALDMLLSIRYIPADAAFILAIYEAVAGGEVEEKEREVTKADITKGVRKALIEPEQGYSMLRDIGYSHEAATFVLYITTYEEPFSPHSYLEFDYLVQWQKGMNGQDAKLPPNELIRTEAAYDKARAIHTALKAKKAPKKEIAEAVKALRIAEYAHGQMLITIEAANEKARMEL